MSWKGSLLFIKCDFDIATEEAGSIINMTDADAPVVESILKEYEPFNSKRE